MIRFTPRRRHLWWVPALAIAFYANGLATQHGLGLGPVLLFGIAPHVPAWLRTSPILSRVLHHLALPLSLVGLGIVGVLSPFWLVGGLAWIGHILGDRVVGYGLQVRSVTFAGRPGHGLGPGMNPEPELLVQPTSS
jgi:hypothetical protein